jgi:DNA-binding NtrC family response regulator
VDRLAARSEATYFAAQTTAWSTSLRAIILDETLEISRRVQSLLAPRGVHLTFASSVEELPTAFAVSGLGDLLIANLSGEFGGWQVAEHLRRTRFDGRTLALVDHLGNPDVAYLMQSPRTQCLVRPRSPQLLDALLEKILSETLLNPGGSVPTPATAHQFHGIVGRSRAMQDLFARIEKVAGGGANVCIYGESGTGKELIARAIHEISRRHHQPFVTLDCTAIPESLVESHLFGHVKGAFTGAVDNREGVFSLAHTGTLFMDELGELGLPLQAKLLRVIQTREFYKVGGTKPIRTNIRLLTATNKDLQKEVERGNFREDLYYRVAVVMINVPPLRERREDIPLLVEHFLEKFAATYHTPIRRVPRSLMDRLAMLPWPGNVRQLENFIEQAVVLGDGDTLSERELAVDTPLLPGGSSGPGAIQLQAGLSLREVEQRYILSTLRDVQGNRTLAARRLGISVRCLQYKLKQYMGEPASTVVPVNGFARIQRLLQG